MARITNPTPKQERALKRWLAKRPPAVRAVAERFDPWSLYRMKSTGDRVTIYSYGEPKSGNEPVTLTVVVSGKYNRTLFDHRVFGIDPTDLEPCELPAADEPVGALLSGDEVAENLDALRVLIGPDLFKMGPDGKALRREPDDDPAAG